MKHTKKIILFVFPGLGKTTACKSIAGLADADFGYIRAANKDMLTSAQLATFCQKYFNILMKEGFIVFTNEPSLIPAIKQVDCSIFMVLPNDNVDMAERIVSREQEHPVNAQWAQEYAKSWKFWVEGWQKAASRYDIPVIKVNYIKEDWSVIEHALQNN